MIKIATFSCVMCLAAFLGLAQSTTGSAYNMYGIGTLSGYGLESFQSKGNAAIGARYPGEVNLKNPAGLNSIVGVTHVFDIGLTASSLTQSLSDASQTTGLGSMSNLNMWMKLGSGSAIAFGASPYSNSKYDITDAYRLSDIGDYYSVRFYGSGGLTQYYLAYSQRIFKNLNVGVRGSLLAGQITSAQYIYNNQILGDIELYNEENIARGVLDFGAQYSLKLGERQSLTVGAIYQPSFKITTDKEQKIISSGADSLTTVSSGEFIMPEMYGVGISFQSKGWTFNADTEIEKWRGNDEGENFSYKNRLKHSFGFEYIKDPQSEQYFDRVKWRGGTTFDNYYLNFKSSSVTNLKISTGLGLPVQWGVGMVNVGYSYGLIKPTTDDLVTETTHTFMLNISIRDVWFQKRKYD